MLLNSNIFNCYARIKLLITGLFLAHFKKCPGRDDNVDFVKAEFDLT